MKSFFAVCLSAAVLSGCSPPAEDADRPEGEQLVKELIQARHDVADSVASVTDTETARQAVDAFQEAFQRSRVRDIMVSRLPDRQRIALQKKHRDGLNAALARMETEMNRAEKIPEVGDIFLQAITGISTRENIPEGYRRNYTD